MFNYLNTIEAYKVCLSDRLTGDPYLGLVEYGIITDFVPTELQKKALMESSRPLEMSTLFSVEERENASFEELISKQILHYLEVYVLDSPGLFDLEFKGGQKVTFTFVKGCTKQEIGELVRKQIYANRPIKDVKLISNIILEYDVKYNINMIKNNEIKMYLFDENTDTFDNGDDAVRYIVYKATESTLLIKSKEVIDAVKLYHNRLPEVRFFEKHKGVLAQVFNRHKRILLACKKNHSLRSVVNEISRLSKKGHVPVKEPVAKNLFSRLMKGESSWEEIEKILLKVDIRDKFKYLNLTEFKLSFPSNDAFVIRNGKIFTKPVVLSENNRQVISNLRELVLYSIHANLAHLKNKNILLDEFVDYGLPISAKQMVGNLPFGTTYEWEDDQASMGIHWKDSWGASDLDLSTVDENGNRVGWGGRAAYGRSDILFSGDVTSAPNGAMEFMTTGKRTKFGLFVNIFSGIEGSKCELVIGKKGYDSKQWIDEVYIREATTLNSKGMILGFVSDGKFVVYQGRLNSKIANFNGGNPILEKNKSSLWTVERLFDAVGIKYDYHPKKDVDYDFDLRYKGFTINKLEDMLL